MIHPKVVVLHESTPACDAGRAMCEHRIGCVVVADHHSHMVGLLTDRDLVCELLANNLSPDTPISEIMTRDVVTAEDSSSLEEVITLMKQHGFRRIPMIHKTKRNKEKCVGIITLDDLIADQTIGSQDLEKIVTAQMIRKSRSRARYAPPDTKSELVMEILVEDVANSLMLENQIAENFIRFVLSSLARRLHFSAALRLANSLPRILEQELLELPKGPNPSITANYIVSGVMNRCLVADSDAKDMLMDFWKILRQGAGTEPIDHILHQLPKDIQLLFTSESPSAGHLQRKMPDQSLSTSF